MPTTKPQKVIKREIKFKLEKPSRGVYFHHKNGMIITGVKKFDGTYLFFQLLVLAGAVGIAFTPMGIVSVILIPIILTWMLHNVKGKVELFIDSKTLKVIYGYLNRSKVVVPLTKVKEIELRPRYSKGGSYKGISALESSGVTIFEFVLKTDVCDYNLGSSFPNIAKKYFKSVIEQKVNL